MKSVSSSITRSDPDLSVNFFLQTAPCLLLFAAFAFGLLISGMGVLPSLFCLVLPLTAGALMPDRKARILLALFILLGFGRGHQFRKQTAFHALRLPSAVQCRIRICDAFAEDRKIRKYQPDNLRVTAVILSAESVNGRGKLPELLQRRILLKMPRKKSSLLKELKKGQELAVKGICSELQENDAFGNSYSRFLKSAGIQGILTLSTLREIKHNNTPAIRFQRAIQNFRERTALRILRRLQENSPESRMLLALSLGYGNALDRNIRKSFILSGTIHIFAISGLHVGLFFTIVFLFLQKCACPMQLRRGAAGILTAGYVCLTGITPSSVRALGMALLLIYSQFRNRPPLPLNTMGLIGLSAVHINPYLLQNIGFLFSYTIVFFLLCSLTATRQLQSILREKELWLPRHLKKTGNNSCRFIGSILSCLIAWGAGLGITMYLNGTVCLFSPFINLPLLPLIPVCLILIPVKICCSYIFSIGEIFCAEILSVILKYMLLLAELGSRMPGTFTLGIQPPESVILFYTGMIMLLFGQTGSLSVSLLCRWKARSEEEQESEEPR